MDQTQEIIKEQLKTLPKIIKDVISSVDLGGKIRKIANKNMLHIDQAGDLENETMFVMLGLEPIEDYKENIRRELNISRDRAQAITAEIDKEIFMSIREAMKKTQIVANENLVTPPPSTPLSSQVVDHTEVANENLVTPPPSTPLSSQVVNHAEESEEIKRQIANQNLARHTAPPPPNLPTAEPVAPAQPQDTDSNLVARHPSGEQEKPQIEKNKPYSSDPYREPIE